MFDLKIPCVDCPFRKGVGEDFGLCAERLEQIRSAVAFQCHRTVDYSGEDGEGFSKGLPGDRPQQCAGLMAVLNRINEPNQIMQVAGRLGRLDFETLDPRNEAYESWQAVLEAHL